MRRLLGLALLLVACSAQPIASPVTTPSTAATPSSSPSPVPEPVSCRLPVLYGVQVGFLSLPAAVFTPATDAGDGKFYDKPIKSWVPVGPPALSSDGMTYAYVMGDKTSSSLHLFEFATARDTVIAQGGPWRVVGLQPDAVYVMRIEYSQSVAFGEIQVGRGLWKVPLEGHVPVQLTNDSRNWAFVSGGSAWGDGFTTDVSGGSNDIVRFDLQTMKPQTWFVPGKRSRVLAIDSGGAPLIMAESDANELWRVAAPDGAVKVWSAPRNEVGPYSPVAVDRAVVWFSSRGMASEWGIYKYSQANGVEPAAKITDRPVMVAGPCA